MKIVVATTTPRIVEGLRQYFEILPVRTKDDLLAAQADAYLLEMQELFGGYLAFKQLILHKKKVVILTYQERSSTLVFNYLTEGAIECLEMPAQITPEFIDQCAKALQAAIAVTTQALANINPSNITLPPPITVTHNKNATKKMVVIAVSTGGPATLERFVLSLPQTFSAPIVIVQHMSKGFIKEFATRLNELTVLNIKVAQAGEVFERNSLYLAPDDAHLAVGGTRERPYAVLLDEPKEEQVRPCANKLFESAAKIFKKDTIGVVLTGMGRDGLRGSRIIKAYDGTIIAQNQASAIIYGMPREVASFADMIVDISQLAPALVQLVEV